MTGPLFVPAPLLPRVSVIVAARDAATTLPACLASLAAVDYPKMEVLVADDGSRDATAAIAERMGARVVRVGGRGPSAARNLGVARCGGEVVAFTDADCTVPRNWLRPLVDALAGERIGSAGGPQRQVFPDGRDEGTNAAIAAFFRLSSLLADYTREHGEGGEVEHNASCNVAYRRDAFEAVGGFTEGLYPAEDVDLDYRLAGIGMRAWYVPEAVVEHHRPGGLRWFAGMMRRYGRGQGQLVRMHGIIRAVQIVPVVTLALGLAQLLWTRPRARLLAGALDATLALTTLALLRSEVPPSLRPGVLRCGLVAAVQWHLGFADGLRIGPPPGWQRPSR